MNSRSSGIRVVVLIVALALAGLFGYFAGFAPALIFVIVSVAVAVAQRDHLASSLRASSPSQRKHLFTTSVVLYVASLTTLYVGFADLDGDVNWSPPRVVFYNVVFFTLLAAALVCGFIGLRAPRSTQ